MSENTGRRKAFVCSDNKNVTDGTEDHVPVVESSFLFANWIYQMALKRECPSKC